MERILGLTYCEYSEGFFTTQPLNTLSSAAFPVAAYFLCRMFRPAHPSRRRICPMAALCVLIGIGSVLWHTYQRPWALAADIAPIFTFLFVFQYTFLKKFTGWTRRRIVADMLGLAAAMGLASLAMNDLFLQKSNAFVPVAFWLIYAGIKAAQRFPRQARLCFIAAAVFILAVIMRILDMPLCGAWPSGTHFLWHTLSAVTLYLAMRCFHPNPKRPL